MKKKSFNLSVHYPYELPFCNSLHCCFSFASFAISFVSNLHEKLGAVLLSHVRSSCKWTESIPAKLSCQQFTVAVTKAKWVILFDSIQFMISREGSFLGQRMWMANNDGNAFILHSINAIESCTIDLNFSSINCSTAWNSPLLVSPARGKSTSGRIHKRILAKFSLYQPSDFNHLETFPSANYSSLSSQPEVNLIELFYVCSATSPSAYLLQLFSGEALTSPSMVLAPGLKKFSLKNLRKCGRFLIRLLLTSFSFSLIWLSSSMFVAFDFDLNAAAGVTAALANADEPRQTLCVPNNPIMSNSCNIKSDRCRMWLSKWFSLKSALL